MIRKTILDRPKDRQDVEQILDRNPSLNGDEIEDWVRRIRAGWL